MGKTISSLRQGQQKLQQRKDAAKKTLISFDVVWQPAPTPCKSACNPATAYMLHSDLSDAADLQYQAGARKKLTQHARAHSKRPQAAHPAVSKHVHDNHQHKSQPACTCTSPDTNHSPHKPVEKRAPAADQNRESQRRRSSKYTGKPSIRSEPSSNALHCITMHPHTSTR